MNPLKDGIQSFLNQKESTEIRQNRILRQAWQKAAGDEAASFTGSVIYDKKSLDIVVVYTVSSINRAELEARKELYRLALSDALGRLPDNPLKEIRFAVSRTTALAKASAKAWKGIENSYVEPVSFTPDEDRHARERVAEIDDAKLKLSLYKAMKATIEWKKGKEASKSSQNRF